MKTNQKRPFGIKIIPLKVSKASFSEDKQKTAIWDDNDPFKGFNNQLSALSKRTSYIFPLGTTLNNLDALVNTETTVSDEELLKYTIVKEKDADEIAIKDYDSSLPDHPKGTGRKRGNRNEAHQNLRRINCIVQTDLPESLKQTTTIDYFFSLQ